MLNSLHNNLVVWQNRRLTFDLPTNVAYLSVLLPWTEILKAVAKNKATIFEKFVSPYSVTIYGNPSAEVIETARILIHVTIQENKIFL